MLTSCCRPPVVRQKPCFSWRKSVGFVTGESRHTIRDLPSRPAAGVAILVHPQGRGERPKETKSAPRAPAGQGAHGKATSRRAGKPREAQAMALSDFSADGEAAAGEPAR